MAVFERHFSGRKLICIKNSWGRYKLPTLYVTAQTNIVAVHPYPIRNPEFIECYNALNAHAYELPRKLCA